MQNKRLTGILITSILSCLLLAVPYLTDTKPGENWTTLFGFLQHQLDDQIYWLIFLYTFSILLPVILLLLSLFIRLPFNTFTRILFVCLGIVPGSAVLLSVFALIPLYSPEDLLLTFYLIPAWLVFGMVWCFALARSKVNWFSSFFQNDTLQEVTDVLDKGLRK